MSRGDEFGTEPQQPSGGSGGTLAGDATGPIAANKVVAVQNVPYSNVAPTVVGQVPTWNGTSYSPSLPTATSAITLVDMGLTLWATPVVGEVGYLSAPNTLAKASASASVTSNVYGVYQGTAGTVSTKGKLLVLFEAGLTLAADDFVYLSLTAGRVTNVQPSTPGQSIVFLGTLRDPTGYVSLTGSALPVLFNAEIPILVL